MKSSQAEARAALLLIKGMITELPQEQQDQLKELDTKIKTVLAEYPVELSSLATTLISTELAASFR